MAAPGLWPGSTQAARQLQTDLADQVIREDRLGPLRWVAGADVGFEAGGRVTRAALAVLSFPDLQLVDYAIARRDTELPYIPGLLSFRECPALLDALAGLKQTPDVVLVDGQGIAHPRRLGVASHFGLLSGLPTIGVAKKRLVGEHAPLPEQRGAWVPLQDRGECIGAVLRSRVGVKPLYVSIGHQISLERAIDLVMACTPKYRLPETTRWADGLASNRRQPPF